MQGSRNRARAQICQRSPEWMVRLRMFQSVWTLVLGPSGAGKSTLVNLLVPQAQALTGEISQALNSGKHTTTTTITS